MKNIVHSLIISGMLICFGGVILAHDVQLDNHAVAAETRHNKQERRKLKRTIRRAKADGVITRQERRRIAAQKRHLHWHKRK